MPGRPTKKKSRRHDADERITTSHTHRRLEQVKCGKCGGMTIIEEHALVAANLSVPL